MIPPAWYVVYLVSLLGRLKTSSFYNSDATLSVLEKQNAALLNVSNFYHVLIYCVHDCRNLYSLFFFKPHLP